MNEALFETQLCLGGKHTQETTFIESDLVCNYWHASIARIGRKVHSSIDKLFRVSINAPGKTLNLIYGSWITGSYAI